MAKLWIVTGGADSGGIVVRSSSSRDEVNKLEERLVYGALIEEIEQIDTRLHYRLINGNGPSEGWIATKLPNKVLAKPVFPDDVQGFEYLDSNSQRVCWSGKSAESQDWSSCAMTFYAISDVHVEIPQNMQWLEGLPRFNKATVIVAGDLGVKLSQVEKALKIFKEKFDHVCYCFGNHETWVHKSVDDAGAPTSIEKLQRLEELCERVGVHTTPVLLHGVWVVPVLGWYHTSWDTEPPLQAPKGKELTKKPQSGVSIATDTSVCKWPCENGSIELAKLLDKQNEMWSVWPLPPQLLENLKKPREQRLPVITYSHFIPEIELMPEKRFLFQPGLTEVVGSNFIRERVRELNPDLHIFGHSHFPWDMQLADGVRYRSWPLGTPAEQARRIACMGSELIELWYPQPVFDCLGRHHPAHYACWFAYMYHRVPRDPWSCRMASYVKAAYCPDAPECPGSLVNPCDLLPAVDEEDAERRRKYLDLCMKSIQVQVRKA